MLFLQSSAGCSSVKLRLKTIAPGPPLSFEDEKSDLNSFLTSRLAGDSVRNGIGTSSPSFSQLPHIQSRVTFLLFSFLTHDLRSKDSFPTRL